jgi:hypothetical protein
MLMLCLVLPTVFISELKMMLRLLMPIMFLSVFHNGDDDDDDDYDDVPGNIITFISKFLRC